MGGNYIREKTKNTKTQRCVSNIQTPKLCKTKKPQILKWSRLEQNLVKPWGASNGVCRNTLIQRQHTHTILLMLHFLLSKPTKKENVIFNTSGRRFISSSLDNWLRHCVIPVNGERLPCLLLFGHANDAGWRSAGTPHAAAPACSYTTTTSSLSSNSSYQPACLPRRTPHLLAVVQHAPTAHWQYTSAEKETQVQAENKQLKWLTVVSEVLSNSLQEERKQLEFKRNTKRMWSDWCRPGKKDKKRPTINKKPYSKCMSVCVCVCVCVCYLLGEGGVCIVPALGVLAWLGSWPADWFNPLRLNCGAVLLFIPRMGNPKAPATRQNMFILRKHIYSWCLWTDALFLELDLTLWAIQAGS